jgi:hypothetical protein
MKQLLFVTAVLIGSSHAAFADPIRITGGFLFFDSPSPFIRFQLLGSGLTLTGEAFDDDGLTVGRKEVILRTGGPVDLSSVIAFHAAFVNQGFGAELAGIGTFRFNASPARLTSCSSPELQPIDCSTTSTNFTFTGDLRLVDFNSQRTVLTEFLMGQGTVAGSASSRLVSDSLIGKPSTVEYTFVNAAPTPEPSSLVLIAAAVVGAALFRRRLRFVAAGIKAAQCATVVEA